MKKILVLVCLFLLTSCVEFKITPGVKIDLSKSATIAKSYDETWLRVVDWFAEHNVIIDKLDKESGIITAKYAFRSDDRFLDCGKIEAINASGEPFIQQYGTLNVTIRKENAASTRVMVNFFGKFIAKATSIGDPRRIIETDGACESTGVLEKSIITSIQQ